MRQIKKIVLAVVLLYAGLCLAVYLFPEYFFYYPYNTPADLRAAQADGAPFTEVVYADYGQSGGKVTGWLYLNKTAENNHKVILFLHGNAYNVAYYYHKTIPLAEAGYSVFIPEYRGFGGQGRKIRQAFLEEDAENAIAFLNKQGFKNRDIVVYGMSLGTYMAIHAVEAQQGKGRFNGLILEVPFTSLLETAKHHARLGTAALFPLDLLVKDTYNSLAKIGHINTRILIMTTKNDQLIPSSQAQALFDAAPQPKMLKMYQGAGHDTLYNLRNYHDILGWL